VQEGKSQSPKQSNNQKLLTTSTVSKEAAKAQKQWQN
jgi:hypothetical protein